MKTRYLMHLAAMTSAAFLAGNAIAADTGMTSTAPMHDNAMTAPSRAGGANNTNSVIDPVNRWMNDYAASHNGRITHKEFMNEMNDRWNTMDTQRHGYLTPQEAQGMFDSAHPGGMAPAAGLPDTAAGVSPGYMGPGSVKGK